MARPKRSHDDCPYEAAAQALKCIGGRWKILIVRYLLEEGETGFNALGRVLPGVSAKMLAQQLRELEADGIVLRRELIETPPKRVVYALTPLGAGLRTVVEALSSWGGAWRAARAGAQAEETAGTALPTPTDH
ncbi:MAG: winged helix-turn-helix transcriptional regulator [Paracoccaceae bacterium]